MSFGVLAHILCHQQTSEFPRAPLQRINVKSHPPKTLVSKAIHCNARYPATYRQSGWHLEFFGRMPAAFKNVNFTRQRPTQFASRHHPECRPKPSPLGIFMRASKRPYWAAKRPCVVSFADVYQRELLRSRCPVMCRAPASIRAFFARYHCFSSLPQPHRSSSQPSPSTNCHLVISTEPPLNSSCHMGVEQALSA